MTESKHSEQTGIFVSLGCSVNEIYGQDLLVFRLFDWLALNGKFWSDRAQFALEVTPRAGSLGYEDPPGGG